MSKHAKSSNGSFHPLSAPDFLPLPQLQALQLQRLKAIVQRAYDRVPLFRKRMEERGLKGRKPGLEVIQLSAENVIYKLNHKERRVLDGQIACAAFSVGTANSKAYSRDIRRQIFDRLVAVAAETLAKIGKTGHRVEQAAWRMAVESWLQENNLITITQNGKVLPYFP